MRFWTGSKLDLEFDWPVAAVLDAFVSHYDLDGSKARHWSVERQLRDWLTDPEGFNATWEDEVAFDELLELVRAEIYGREPDYSTNHVS